MDTRLKQGLLATGSPLWFSLTIAALAVAFSFYVSLWALIVSFWAVFVAVAGSALGGVASGVVFVCTGYVAAGVAMLAAGLVCAGLSIFCFFGCRAITRGVVRLTGKTADGCKRLFIRKEEML